MNNKPLYSLTNYLKDTKYIKSANIIEYDLRACNINALLECNRISLDEYYKLLAYPKYEREVSVGLMIHKDPTIGADIRRMVVQSKQKLFETNGIRDDEVIRIANDAVYVNRAIPLRNTKFGHMEFAQKHHYSTFLRVATIVILISSNYGDIDLDVIGLGSDKIPLHEEYMLNFIGNLLYMMEISPSSEVLDYFLEFYHKYLTRELDIGYYRELNSDSLYTFKYNDGYKIGISELNDPKNPVLDIGYNASILRELYKIIVESWV